MAGGSIFAGMFGEPYDPDDLHTRFGVTWILVIAAFIIFLIRDPFKGLVYSQMLLSVQLPITVFLQIYLTSSERVMGKYKNGLRDKILLVAIGVILTILNIMLFIAAGKG